MVVIIIVVKEINVDNVKIDAKIYVNVINVVFIGAKHVAQLMLKNKRRSMDFFFSSSSSEKKESPRHSTKKQIIFFSLTINKIQRTKVNMYCSKFGFSSVSLLSFVLYKTKLFILMGSLCCGQSDDFSSSMDRLTKLSIVHQNPLALIEGYQNEPLLPLEATLDIFQHSIKNLSNQITEAKRNCLQTSKHGLSHDESAAIYLYSMGKADDTNSVYCHLQNAWNSNDPYEMKPWLKYVRLLYNGVDKLPNVKGEVWQGIPHSENGFYDLRSKQKTSFTLMGSASTSIDEVDNYLKQKRIDQRILIGYDRVNGKNVSGYTTPNFPSVLLYPGVKLNSCGNIEQFSDGSIAFHFTKKIGELRKTKFNSSTFYFLFLISGEVKAKMKHFRCQNIRCINRCRLNHVDHRCSGFILLKHEFSHRCAPPHRCRLCKKSLEEIYQCKICEFTFCKRCCMK